MDPFDPWHSLQQLFFLLSHWESKRDLRTEELLCVGDGRRRNIVKSDVVELSPTYILYVQYI